MKKVEKEMKQLIKVARLVIELLLEISSIIAIIEMIVRRF